MKFLLIPLTFLANCVFTQTTIELQPHFAEGNNTYLRDYNPYTPVVGTVDLTSYVWTCDGNRCVGRALFTFDFSSIIEGAIIENATLYLYANTTTSLGYGGSEPHTGDNSAHIFRVTEAWNYNTVTWGSQPDISYDNSIEIPQSTEPAQDYVLDVTTLIQAMIDNPEESYGMTIRLDNEFTYYTSLIFASSFNLNEEKHPKLEVTYSGQNMVSDINTEQFLLSPNPAHSFININFPNNTTSPVVISVIDAIGNCVKSIYVPNNSNEINLEISDLADGIYLMSTNNGYSKKFVVTK